MDLDPDKVTNNMNEAARQAELMKQQQQPPASPMQPPMQQPQAGAPGVPNVADPTGAGGGNIGVGQVPIPGEQGFAANTQPQEQAPQQAATPPQA
jgi:hypothetical protein